MAGFKTHITTSTVLGVAYGGAAWAQFDVPLPAAILGGALCSVSGMLPDLDSDSGVPLRESIAFAAAVVPMLLVHRFEHLGMAAETMVLIGAGVYVAIRFGLSKLLAKYTVHRGMFHSIPAALIAAELGFLLCTCEEVNVRLFKAGGILLGFMSHLVLDELWSISWRRGFPRLKKSSGTALKFFGQNLWGNLSTYIKLGLLSWVCLFEPSWMRENLADAWRGGHTQEAHAETGGGRGRVYGPDELPPEDELDDDAETSDDAGDETLAGWLKKVWK